MSSPPTSRSRFWLRVSFALGLLVAVTVFFSLGWQHELSLSALKMRQHALAEYRAAHPVGFPLAYLGVYIACAALSIPVAGVLSIAGGALFGLLEGTLIVSFASSIGAVLAFMASRFLFRAAVQRRFGERLNLFNDNIRREGAFYLFTLRLIPIIPYFVINLVMGLTSLPALTFYWVSQLGMFATTLALVNAGTQLATLNSMSDVLSLRLLGSLAVLGVLPWFARWLVATLRARRA